MKLGDKMTGGQEHVSAEAINAKNYTTIAIGVYLAASALIHFVGKGGSQAIEQAETRLLPENSSCYCWSRDWWPKNSRIL